MRFFSSIELKREKDYYASSSSDFDVIKTVCYKTQVQAAKK